MKNNYSELFKQQYSLALSKVDGSSSKGNTLEYNVFVKCAMVGIPKEDIPELMTKYNQKKFDPKSLKTIKKAYDWVQNNYKGKATVPPAKLLKPEEPDNQKDKLEQIENFLSSHCMLRYNEIRHSNEIKFSHEEDWQFMTDRTRNSLWRAINKNGIYVNMEKLNNILNSDFATKFNPFKDYFDQLPEWDGIDYMEQLVNTIEVKGDNAYFKVCLTVFMTGMVACSYENDPNHSILILEGLQGTGKTKWLRKLVPILLAKYYAEKSIDVDSKDFMLLLGTMFLINFDELANSGKSDHESVKRLSSSREEFIRVPYGKEPEHFLRTASFVGSINHMDFLRDPSGSRRYLCFEVLKIDTESEVDMNKVYSQLFYLFKNGGKRYFDQEDIRLIEKRNEEFTFIPEVEQCVISYIVPCERNHEGALFATSSQLVGLFYEKKLLSKRDDGVIQNLGRYLRKHRFKSFRTNGSTKYSYLLSETYDNVTTHENLEAYIKNSNKKDEGMTVIELFGSSDKIIETIPESKNLKVNVEVTTKKKPVLSNKKIKEDKRKMKERENLDWKDIMENYSEGYDFTKLD